MKVRGASARARRTRSAREADDLGGTVDARAVVAEDLERPVGREADTDLLEDPQGRVLEPVELLVVEELDPAVGADGLQRRSGARGAGRGGAGGAVRAGHYPISRSAAARIRASSACCAASSGSGWWLARIQATFSRATSTGSR